MKKSIMIICTCTLVLGMLHAQQNKTEILNQLPVESMISKAVSEATLSTKSFMIVKRDVIPYPDSWTALTPVEKQLRLFNILSRLSAQSGISYPFQNAGPVKKNTISDSYYMNASVESEKETEETGDNSRQAESEENEHKKEQGKKQERENSEHEFEHEEKEEHALADPVCQVLPLHVERIAEQNETLFGDVRYNHIFTSTDNETLLAATNLSKLKYLGSVCAEKNEYTMYMSVMQSEAGIVVTSVTTVNNHNKDKKILFWNLNLADIFSRKTDAVFAWYRSQLSLEK